MRTMVDIELEPWRTSMMVTLLIVYVPLMAFVFVKLWNGYQ